MAKVDTIKMTVNGKDYSFNINVGKSGMFKCSINHEVVNALGLQRSLHEFSNLHELKVAILKPYQEYLEATKTEQTLIWIRYVSSGEYSKRIDGHQLFPHHSEYRCSGFAGEVDKLGFSFGVCIKETSSTGAVIWYEAKKGQGSVYHEEQEEKDPSKYYKDGQISRVQGKLIPFTENAFNTLKKAQEGMRKISEILFNLVDQEEKQIESILLGGRLLLGMQKGIHRPFEGDPLEDADDPRTHGLNNGIK